MSSQTSIILFVVLLAMHVTLYAIGGILLFVRRKEQRDRTRIILGSFMTITSVCIVQFIVDGLVSSGGMEDYLRACMQAYPLIFVFFIWALMPCYLIEMLRPYYLTWRRILCYFSLPLAISVLFIIWHAAQGFADFTPIYSFQDIFDNITKVDVVLRLLLMAFWIVSAFVVFMISKDWRRSNAPQPYFNVMAISVCAIAFTFDFGLTMRVPLVMVLHCALIDTFCAISLYVEFYVRIPVPQNIAQESINLADGISDYECCSPELIRHLQNYIATDFWKNPDLHQADLCNTFNTNRTYLLAAIHVLGYSNYSEMVNQLRVKYIHAALDKDPQAHLFDLCFKAGFRNRNTANRAFLQLYGCLPSVYQKQAQMKKLNEDSSSEQ